MGRWPALAAGLALVLLLWAPWRPLPAAAPLRVSAELGADASLVIAAGGAGAPAGNAAVVSPDGSQLAFVAQPHGGGAPRLYVRRLDQLTATPLAGTDNAVGPFFSPDGQWLGFFAGGRLKKIAVTGGAPVALADAPSARGGSWAEDGTIVFTPTSENIGLWRVPAVGGPAERLTTPAPGEYTHRWPQVLPGGRAVLYTVSTGIGNYTNAWLAVQPLPAGTPHIAQRGGSYGRYLPSGLGSPKRAERESGHLTWVHDGTLFAAPFDLATLVVTGPAVPVLPGVESSSLTGDAQVEVSHTGTLVYLPGGENALTAPLDWLTRDGKTTPLRATPANWSGVQIAPDGRRLAFSLTDAANTDVWTYDAARDALTRLTFDPGVDRNPVWTPDGRRLVYASSRSGGAQNLYWQRADGSGDATRLTTSPNHRYPGSWHPSGRFLAFQETRPQTGNDLLILPVEGDEASGWKPGHADRVSEWAVHRAAAALLAGRAVAGLRIERVGRLRDLRPAVSGTGRQVADLHRAAAPMPSGRARGMSCSTWRPTGGSWWCRTRPPATRFRPRSRASGARRRSSSGRTSGASFDLHPDGERVAMAPATEATAGPTHVTLIFNFFDELRRLAPVTKR